MAKFIPSLQEILNDKRHKPTDGEWFLLNELSKYLLDDRFEVYFQPILNGDFPDIIVFRQDYGVYIIEIKDWNLDNFFADATPPPIGKIMKNQKV